MKMENEHNHCTFKGIVITILLLLLVCAGICTYKYINGEIPDITQTSNSLENVEFETESLPTVEQAMQEWKDLREYSRCHEVYMSLPPEIMQALFEKLGTLLPIRDYVYEYENNREYYISLQIAKQLEKSGIDNIGVDGERIEKVKIKTELKPEKPKKKVNIPVEALPTPVENDTTNLSMSKKTHYYYDMKGGYYYTESRL